MTRPIGLTEREWEIAQRIGRGERTKTVAEALVVSPRTVETHLASVYRKLGIRSRSELVMLLNDVSSVRPAEASLPMPQTQYARAGTVSIAYQVFGDGPVDIVMVPGLASHLELLWEYAGWRRFVARLSSVGRLIVFDKRGTGLSDPVELSEFLTLDQRMKDALAVLDAAGSRRAVVFGISEGGPMGVYAAAAAPDRIAGLCIYGSAVLSSPDGRERRRRLLSLAEASYGTGLLAGKLWPSMTHTAEDRAWLARYERHACSPGMISRLIAMNIDIDVAGMVDAVRTPVVIVHNVSDTAVPYVEAERLAAAMPGAKLYPIGGVDHVPWGEIDIEALVVAMRDVTDRAQQQKVVPKVLRALVAVVECPADRQTQVQDWIGSSAGRVTLAGDAVLGVFDSVSRAVQCAESLIELVPEARIAVHSGEVVDAPVALGGSTVVDVVSLARAAAPHAPKLSRVVQLMQSAG